MEQLNERQKQRLMVLTSWCCIEGTYHFVPGIRLSDSVNSELSQKARYLPLTDVVVRHLESGRELLQTRFMLIAHMQITGIAPKTDVVDRPHPAGSPGVSAEEIDHLVDQMNTILSTR